MPQQYDQTTEHSARSNNENNNQQQANNTMAAPQQETVQKPEPNQTGIPDNLKASMEYMYGLSLKDVRVYYDSEKPATMGAYAYTEGLNIYIASGQEKYLAHELAHVMQQMNGEVKETVQLI